MRFSLIDQIVEFESGKSLTAVKSATLSEDYLQDHFPLFPVIPGVLLLESMYQSAAWLIREHDNFAHSMVLLKEARTVKYAGFVRPGQVLRVHAVQQKKDDAGTWFKTRGTVEDKMVVSARLHLGSYNLADHDPAEAVTDEHIRSRLRREFKILYHSSPESIQVDS
jgi:3-hydroxyacyl-[acyl-carrier-protein] dehydratase